MLRVCKTCGITFEGAYDALKCPECTKRFITKDNIIRDRTCIICGAKFKGGPRALYCEKCKKDVKKERDKACKARQKAGKTRKLGSKALCEVCGKEYVVKAGTQKYCENCAYEAVRKIDREQSKMWNAANTSPEKRRKERQAAAADLICVVCGKKFHPNPRRATATTCSKECSKILRQRRKMEVEND